MAGHVLMKVSRDEEERARLLRDEKIELDYQSKMVTAQRLGFKKGYDEGIEQGIEQGIEKGQEQNRQYILELINQGLSAEEIKQKLRKE